MTDNTNDKLLYLEKLVGSLRNEILDCTNYMKSTQEEFLKINSLFEDQDKLEAELEKQAVSMKKDSETKNNSLSHLQLYTEISKKSFVDLEQKIKDLSEKDDAALSEISYLKLKFKDIQESLDSVGVYIKKIQEEGLVTKNLLTDHVNKTYLKLTNLNTISEEHGKKIVDIKQTAETTKSNTDQANALYDNMLKEINSAIKTNHSNLSTLLKNLTDKTEGLMSSKVEDENKDLGLLLDEAIADLKKSFQTSQIEVHNATLRTSNAATQIQIIEKKIENIYLLLKKFELGS